MDVIALAHLGQLIVRLSQRVAERFRQYFEPGPVYDARHAYIKPIVGPGVQQRKRITVDTGEYVAQFSRNVQYLSHLADLVRASSSYDQWVDLARTSAGSCSTVVDRAVAR